MMTDDDRAYHARWRPASGHPSGRWRVCRRFIPPLEPEKGEPNFQEARGPRGRVRYFKTFESASRAAHILNNNNN
jgi:hypothetical protein